MADMEYTARNIIEAMRSGIPSFAVGGYFTEARPQTKKAVETALDDLAAGNSGGMIFKGKYGEGKTHLLNSIFSLAHQKNMVVSKVSVSKEMPLHSLESVYSHVIANTYLHGTGQPDLLDELQSRLGSTELVDDLVSYAENTMENGRLACLIRILAAEEETDERVKLLADLEGNFLKDSDIKARYRAKFDVKQIAFKKTFSSKTDTMVYFEFMSYLFERLGYAGWVILFDECELMKKASLKSSSRGKAYCNIHSFLHPDSRMHRVYSFFAFTDSYVRETIDDGNEYQLMEKACPDTYGTVKSVLKEITKAHELKAITDAEIDSILASIIGLHAMAYDWRPKVETSELKEKIRNAGFLLRTKLRSAIEYLDQMYQYGDAEDVKTEALTEVPSLDDLEEADEA